MKEKFPLFILCAFAIFHCIFYAAKAETTDSVLCMEPQILTPEGECDSFIQNNYERSIPAENYQATAIPVNRRTPARWLFFLFFIQLLIVTYLRVVFGKSLSDLFRGFWNANISQQLSREQEVSMPFSAFFLNLNFVISIGIFLYLLVDHYHLKNREFTFQLFLFVQWTVIMIVAMKYGLMKFMAIIFPVKEEMDYFNFNFFLNLKIAGIVLLPLNLFIAYAPSPFNGMAIALAAVFLALLFLVTIFRGFQYGKSHFRFNKVHFFLYICTLEIAPYLILVKVISGWLQ